MQAAAVQAPLCMVPVRARRHRRGRQLVAGYVDRRSVVAGRRRRSRTRTRPRCTCRSSSPCVSTPQVFGHARPSDVHVVDLSVIDVGQPADAPPAPVVPPPPAAPVVPPCLPSPSSRPRPWFPPRPSSRRHLSFLPLLSSRPRTGGPGDARGSRHARRPGDTCGSRRARRPGNAGGPGLPVVPALAARGRVTPAALRAERRSPRRRRARCRDKLPNC